MKSQNNVLGQSDIPWVYSKYRSFDPVLDLFVGARYQPVSSLSLKQSAGEKKNIYISFNGQTISCESSEKGIELLPLRVATEKYGHLLEGLAQKRRQGKKEDKASALARELSSEGYFLYVHPNVFPEFRKENVVQIYVSIGQDGVLAMAHNYVVVGKGNKIRIIEEQLPIAFGGQSANASYTEIFCEEGSETTYTAITTPSDDIYAVRNIDWYLEKDSVGDMVDILLGGKAVKQNIRSYLIGTGATYTLEGIGIATGRQAFETDTLIANIATHTSGKVLYKNIVTGEAKLSCDGLIKIEKDADQTNSYLESHTLVLSDTARADAVPSLEIEANEVKASHGATIGNIDKQQLLYAMSRGLNEKEAESLIVSGFTKPILDRMYDVSIAERITGYITKKLHE